MTGLQAAVSLAWDQAGKQHKDIQNRRAKQAEQGTRKSSNPAWFAPLFRFGCCSSFFPPKEPGPSLPFRQGVLSSIRMEAACNTQNLVKLIFVNEIQLLQANNYPFKVTFL